MKIRLNERARAPVRPRVFWVNVAVVGAMVGGMGVYGMQAGHDPLLIPHLSHSPWFLAGVLLLFWAVLLSLLLRQGRLASPWQRVLLWVQLTAGTLAVGAGFWPHPPAAVTWTASACSLLALASAVSLFFEFGKPRDGIPGGSPPTSAV